MVSDTWWRDVAAGDGVYPDRGGYAMLASFFIEWPPWRAWVATDDHVA
jgi:hypothetical protein